MFQYPNDALSLHRQSPVQRWAVLVGVNNYLGQSVNLSFCVNNAQAFHHFLITQPAYGYSPDRSRLLLSRQAAGATRRGVWQALEETARQLQTTDLLLFYFSGPVVCLNGEACLLPADAELDPDNHRPVADTVIPAQRLKTSIRETGAQAKAIILDVWYSDWRGGPGQSARRGGEKDFIRNIFQDAPDLDILMALAPNGSAREQQNSASGIFTTFLLDGLRMGMSRNGVVSVATMNDVHDYVVQQMNKNGIGRDRLILEHGGSGETSLLAWSRPVSPPPGAPLWPPDLGPITERKNFYNRVTELEDIRRVLKTAIQAGKAIIVRGERCTGKTSLINRTRQLLTEEIWPGQHYVGVNIAPNSITSCADFAGELWGGLKVRLKQPGDLLVEEPAIPFRFDTVARFVAQLERCQADCADTTVVVFIDEFDHIMHQCTELETQKIIGLIRYLVEATNLSLVFFIVMLRDLPTGHGSPFPHAKILLHPLKQADFYELAVGLLGAWATIPRQTLAWLYGFTNGHPYFIRLVLNYLTADPPGSLEPEMVQAAARLAMVGDYAHEILGDIYRNYLNNDERYIWLWLTQYGGELPVAEVKEAAVALKGVFKRLERRDFIASTPAGGYRLHPYLCTWLAEWPEFAAEAERLEVPCPQTALPEVAFPPEINAPHKETATGLCIDRQSKRVYQAGQEISDLPPGGLEYRALVYLAERAGQVVSKDDLAKYVWQQDYYQEDDQRISAVIYRLRRTYGVRSLQTLRKAGYRLPQATLIYRTYARRVKFPRQLARLA